jgi:hypothetical protein
LFIRPPGGALGARDPAQVRKSAPVEGLDLDSGTPGAIVDPRAAHPCSGPDAAA